MKRFVPVLLELGPLAIFWILLYTVDLKVAIGVGVVLLLLDAAFRYWRGMPITKLYVLSGGLTVVFGVVDLWAQTPFSHAGAYFNVEASELRLKPATPEPPDTSSWPAPPPDPA